MAQVRAEHTFTLEADFLGDSLRRHVVGICDEIESLQVKLFQPMAGKEAERSGTDTVPTSRGGHPVSDAPAVVDRIDLHADSSNHSASERNRKRVLHGPHVAANECQGVCFCVRRGNDRDPPLDLRVVALGDERRNIGFRPRTQDEIAVTKLHDASVRPTLRVSSSSRLHTPSGELFEYPRKGFASARSENRR